MEDVGKADGHICKNFKDVTPKGSPHPKYSTDRVMPQPAPRTGRASKKENIDRVTTDERVPPYQGSLSDVHDPGSHNCAVFMSYTRINFTANLNTTELHLQGVAPRSQYSDPTPEAVMLQ